MGRIHDEITAMQAVAAALGALPCAESRVRVLRWACDHFGIDLTSSTQEPLTPHDPSAPTHPAAPLDPETLDSLFVDGQGPAAAVAGANHPEGSVVNDLHSFVADFQKLARDWHNV